MSANLIAFACCDNDVFILQGPAENLIAGTGHAVSQRSLEKWSDQWEGGMLFLRKLVLEGLRKVSGLLGRHLGSDRGLSTSKCKVCKFEICSNLMLSLSFQGFRGTRGDQT